MGKLADQAKKLASSKYAPIFAQIAANRTSNQSAYDAFTDQRIAALNREYGSIKAAGATTAANLTKYGDESASMYQQALAQSQKTYEDTANRVAQSNSNLLSSLAAERAARGLEAQTENDLSRGMAHRNEMLAGINEINKGALERQGTSATDTFRMMKGSSEMIQNSASSAARGSAQGSLDDAYKNFLAKLQELETQETVTKKEKADYRYQTLLTLKEQARQAKAEAAALAQEYAYKGAVLSETQRHNMANEANTQSRLNLDAAKFTASQNKSSAKTKGFNAANTYLEKALRMQTTTRASVENRARLVSAIKNSVPQMGSGGDGYSRGSKAWETLLLGGGATGDLDRYITSVLSSSGWSTTSANKALVRDILNQYALVAQGKA